MKKIYASKRIGYDEIEASVIPTTYRELLFSTGAMEVKAAASVHHPVKLAEVDDPVNMDRIYKVRSFAVEDSDVPILVEALELLYWRAVEIHAETRDEADERKIEKVNAIYQELLAFHRWNEPHAG